MKTFIQKNGLLGKASEVAAVLLLGAILLPQPARAGIAIEEAQRMFQGRYFFCSATDVTWPGCPCQPGVSAPFFPPDGFYGDLDHNPELTIKLVADLRDHFYSNYFELGSKVLCTKFVNTPDGFTGVDGTPSGGILDGEMLAVTYTTNLDMPWTDGSTFDMYGNLNAGTVTNVFNILMNYIGQLNYVYMGGYFECTTTNCQDYRAGWSGGADNCADAEAAAMTAYNGGIGGAGGIPGQHIYSEFDGTTAIAFVSVANSATSCDPKYAFYGFTSASVQIYILVNPDTGGLGPFTSPVSSDGNYHYLASGSIQRDVHFDSPPVFTTWPTISWACDPVDNISNPHPEVHYGWSVPETSAWPPSCYAPAMILKPNFKTDADSDESCAAQGCGSPQCHVPGSATISTRHGSFEMRIGLGPDSYGNSAGYLYVNASQFSTSLASSSSLNRVLSADTTQSVDYDFNPTVTTDNTIATLTNDTLGYQITFTDTAGTPNFMSYVSVYLASTNLGTNQITITNIVGDMGNTPKVTVINYTNDGTTVTWAKVEGGGLRTEACATTNDSSGNPTDVITVTDTNGAVASVATNVYQMYPWGKTLVQQTLGTGSAARTTTWTYDASTGHLAQMVEPTGRWEKYRYDAGGRMTNLVAQFLDNPSTSADSSNRLTVTSYDAGGNITTVEYLLGTEISRTYEFHSLSGVVEQIQTIRCATAGAATNASDNLTNFTWRITDDSLLLSCGVSQWDTLYTSNQDGTMSFYTNTIASGQKTTIMTSGMPNSGKTAIVDGTESITVVGPYGQIISNIVEDVESGLILQQDSYTYSTPPTSDAQLNRSYTLTHLDTTTDIAYYDCCGLQYTVDRDQVETDYIYDAARRLIGTTRLGITTTNWLDGDGRTLETFRVGSDTTTMLLSKMNYDSAGFMLNETNALVGVTTHAWTTNGAGEMIVTTTNPDGGTMVQTNFENGFTFQTGGTAANPLRYLYGVDSGAHNALATEIKLSTGGGTNEWTESCTDLLGRPYKTVYAEASSTPTATSYYNAIGQMVKQVDPDGVTTLYRYNGKGEKTTAIVNLDGSGTLDTSNDRITFTTNFVTTDNSTTVRRTDTYVCATTGSASSNLIATVESSADGLRTWSTNWDGRNPIAGWTRTVYAGSGYRYLTNMTSYGLYTVTAYLSGRVVSTTSYSSGNGQIGQTANGYDAHGRMNTVTDARTGTTTNFFNSMDLVSGTATPSPGGGQSSQVTSNFFDNLGRIIKTTMPDGTSVTNVYYLTGQIAQTFGSRTYPAGYGYDVQGRMIKMTNWTSFASGAGARVTTWNFDQYRGLLSSKQYDDGNGPSYDYTAAGRLQHRYWVRGTNTTYAYNGAGDLATVSYNDGVTSSITNGYDRLGHNTIVSNSPTLCTMTYGILGNLLITAYTNGPLNGVAVTNGYDSTLRRIKTVTLTNGVVICTVTNNYDAASRLSLISDTTNSATYSYLANSPLVSQITFDQNTTTRMTTTKGYDNLNRFLGSTNVNGATVLDKHAYGYNSANQRTTVTNVDNSYWNYGYDSLGQVTSGKKYWSDGVEAAGEQFGYGFDDIGNRVSAQAGGNDSGTGLRSASYYVNDLNQYTSRTVPGFADIVGTASTSATVTVNALPAYRHSGFFRVELPINNAVAAVWQTVTNLGVIGGISDTVSNVTGSIFLPKNPELFTYDNDGNMTSDGRFTNTWDGENRLINITSRSGPVTPSLVKLDLTYDWMGRRIQKIVSTNSGSGYVASYTNRFVYDGWNVVAVLDGGNHPLYSFVWGSDLSGTTQGAGGVSGLISMTVYSGASTGTYFYYYDGNGNVATMINATDSTLAAVYEYEPFGKLIGAWGSMAFISPFRFSTKYHDGETLWDYYGYRYMREGSWINRDPIGDLATVALLFKNADETVFNQTEWVSSGFHQMCRTDSYYGKKVTLRDSPTFHPQCDLIYGFVQNNPLYFIDMQGLAPTISVDYASCCTTIGSFALIGGGYAKLVKKIQAYIDSGKTFPEAFSQQIECFMTKNGSITATCNGGCCKTLGAAALGCSINSTKPISICPAAFVPGAPRSPAVTAVIEAAKQTGCLSTIGEYAMANWLVGL